MLDCGDGGLLGSVETLLAHIMLPALMSQQVQPYGAKKVQSLGEQSDCFTLTVGLQTWGSVQDGTSCPNIRSFLSAVDRFVANLSSARVSMERKFQLQQVELPDTIDRLSSPADYTAAGQELVQLTVEVQQQLRKLQTFCFLLQQITVSWWSSWRAWSHCGPTRSGRC